MGKHVALTLLPLTSSGL